MFAQGKFLRGERCSEANAQMEKFKLVPQPTLEGSCSCSHVHLCVFNVASTEYSRVFQHEMFKYQLIPLTAAATPRMVSMTCWTSGFSASIWRSAWSLAPTWVIDWKMIIQDRGPELQTGIDHRLYTRQLVVSHWNQAKFRRWCWMVAPVRPQQVVMGSFSRKPQDRIGFAATIAAGLDPYWSKNIKECCDTPFWGLSYVFVHSYHFGSHCRGMTMDDGSSLHIVFKWGWNHHIMIFQYFACVWTMFVLLCQNSCIMLYLFVYIWGQVRSFA